MGIPDNGYEVQKTGNLSRVLNVVSGFVFCSRDVYLVGSLGDSPRTSSLIETDHTTVFRIHTVGRLPQHY